MLPISPDLIVSLGGALGGFVMRAWTQATKNRHDLFKLSIQGKQEADISADKAEKRGGDYGKVTRRAIVVVVLSLFAYLMVTPLMDIDTVVEIKKVTPKFFWGLWGGNEVTEFENVSGYLFTDTTRQAVLAMLGFYFGQAAAKP
jgi:hypothetical protein